MTTHNVKQGETLFSISRQYNVPLGELRNEPDNRELFEKRESSNILFEGDQVVIPDCPPKESIVQTGGTCSFCLQQPLIPIAIEFGAQDSSWASVPCVYYIDGTGEEEGEIDASGWFHVEVPLESKEIIFKFFKDTDYEEEYTVNLGHLDPGNEARGLQQRLNNLGFSCGAEDGDMAEKTKVALKAFQKSQGLPFSDSLDETTETQLRRNHFV